MNWTGHALVAPRSRVGEALRREETGRTGVYFLFGDDPEQPSKSRVYIGEGDNVSDRIKLHAKDEAKDFWTRCCIVTSKDTNLTKAHVRYLENRFVELAKSADRANVANANEPGRKNLPESDIADMEFFISQVQVILPVIGMDFLRQRPQFTNTRKQEPEDKSQQNNLVLQSRKYKYEARAIETDGEIVVLKNSTATTKADFVSNGYGNLRDQLVQDERLVATEDPDLLRFAEDVTFASPSAAASVIRNRNTNGRTSWKLADTGMTLKEWQDAQLG
jgi:hypothetical protein